MDYFGQLPLEILDEIACDELTYRGLLTLPQFARSLTIGRRFDFKVKFGHDVRIHSPNVYGDVLNYMRNGKKHRLDGPAVIHSNGDLYWMRDGESHRTNGPAIEIGKYKRWCRNGLDWRENGPTIEQSDGTIIWTINKGIFHRLDGPAMMNTNGMKKWFIYGEQVSRREFNKYIANMTK